LAGAVVLYHGALAELATGEGKTLVAALPAFLNALTGKGVHVTTVNDYLAARDADWMGPIYDALGLTTGVLQAQMPEADRRRAYRCDITYGTASELGFDFLRDRLRVRYDKMESFSFWSPWASNGKSSDAQQGPVQRDHHYAIVDEADCIFIDDSRTPLIVAAPTRPATAKESVPYQWADRVARTMVRDTHFTWEKRKQQFVMTEEGQRVVRYSKLPLGPGELAMDNLHDHIDRALQANHRLHRDQHYMVEDGKIMIIDEYTGRRLPDRHWREGLHQAVEVKENVPVTFASEHAAQITFQNYFRLYRKLSGMTGTAAPNWWEIRRVYKIWVVPVPTNRPVVREQWPDRVFPTMDAKFAAVVEEVSSLKDQGRPVLIGTRSVEKSEKLSCLLQQAGIEHQVLNAKQPEREAGIVARAGQRGQVTIATNMAGRGTDIKLTAEVVRAGGLHVLGTERHDAKRIDRQLAGRAGRQGDPGSCQFFLALDDELLEGLGSKRRERLQNLDRTDLSRNWQRFLPRFRRAQRRIERRHRRERVDLLAYEKHRQEILKDLGADPYVD
jgi:preprotein translocase subunit SecA